MPVTQQAAMQQTEAGCHLWQVMPQLNTTCVLFRFGLARANLLAMATGSNINQPTR
jgi:hypothetical protein